MGLIFFLTISFLAYRYYKNRNIKDTQDLEEIIEKNGTRFIKKDESVGMVIGVVKNEKVCIKGFGRKSKESDEIPDGKTLFELASIGKVFTTSAVQILVDRGEISWDYTIDKYLNKKTELCKEAKEITLRHLAIHKSGLPSFPKSFFPKVKDKLNPYKDLTKQDLYDYLTTCKENSETRKYKYSNLGMGLLGHILEIEKGKAYEAIIKEEIVEKLDMSNTTIMLNEEQKEFLAQGYNKEGNPNPVWEDRVLTGAGSFLSNAEDMCNFIKANFDAKQTEISKSLIKTHEKEFDGRTGLGWHYYSRFLTFMTGEDDVIWHNGTAGGYTSFIAINKKAKTGVIILSNSINDVTILGMKIILLAKNISFKEN